MLGVFCVDICSSHPSTDARCCLNSVSVYESGDVLKENDWSLSDGRDLLSDQQTAEIIWFVVRVVCNCDTCLELQK